MKTIIITLFFLIIGFFQFFFSDPYISQSIHYGLCLLCVFAAGLTFGQIQSKNKKTDENIDRIIATTVKDVAAVAMDNVNCRLNIIELEAKIRQLKNDKENNRMNEGRLRKEVAGLKDDLKKANARIQEAESPLISEIL